MLHLVPDALDPHTAFAHLYDSLYETPPAFVTELMALTPCADDDPRSLARHRPLSVFRAPLTHPLSDREQWDALLLDHDRFEDRMTATIRATSSADLHLAPTPLYTHWRRDYISLPPVSGDAQLYIGG